MPFSIDQIYAALRAEPGGHDKFYSLTQGNNIDAFLDTPRLWGQSPVGTYYVPAAGNLRTAITDLIRTATKTVDIAVLFPFPNGLFLDALRAGFAAINPSIPIRITAGYYVPIPPATLFTDPVQEIVNFLNQLALRPNTPVHVALMQTWATSWNHSKLIIVDGQRTISGGHNMWSNDYTQFAPVSDVSFQFSGPASETGENFINNIWNRMWYDENNTSRRETPPMFWARTRLNGQTFPPPQPVIFDNTPQRTGNTLMLAVGRTGINLEPLVPLTLTPPTFANNPSLVAKILAVRQMAGGGHIRMSQQMLGGSPLGEYDPFFFPELYGHLIGGGELSLIISDTGATTISGDSYSGDGVEATARHFVQAVKAARPDLTREQLIDLFTELLHIGPTRICDNDGLPNSWMWRDETREIEPANHAKVMIFGHQGFYIGSDNAYAMPFNPLGMQEFGHMIEGEAETQSFMQEYWEKAWYYSSQYQFTDWARLVDEPSEPTTPRMHAS